MNKKTLLISAVSLLLTSISSTGWSTDAMPGKAFNPISSECDAKTDGLGGGDNCNVPSQCLEASAGNFVMEESVHVDTEKRYSGTNYGCNWVKSGYATVKGRFQVLNKVCIAGYAHSTSGIDYANAKGGVKCTLTGRYDVIPPM
ncbi:hypothetical protein BCS42_13860 [Crenothrix sp. D3]|nr:hypothetical protein BCS42_13860 [Crenothrix sp. D3]